MTIFIRDNSMVGRDNHVCYWSGSASCPLRFTTIVAVLHTIMAALPAASYRSPTPSACCSRRCRCDPPCISVHCSPSSNYMQRRWAFPSSCRSSSFLDHPRVQLCPYRESGETFIRSVSEKIGGREVEDAYPSEPSDSGSESLASPSDCVVSVLLRFRTRDEGVDALSVVWAAEVASTIPKRSSTVLRTCQV